MRELLRGTADRFMTVLGRRQEDRGEHERLELLDGLERTRVQIQQAYLQFDTAGDPDLIESSVFEIKSLQARYSYLLRQVKALGGR